MNTIAVRHDLGPAQKALLAALGWDYVIRPDAPRCERFDIPRGKLSAVRLSEKPCPRCEAAA